MSCGDVSYKDDYMPGYTQDPAVLKAVTDKLVNMTTADKAAQMQGTDPGPDAMHNWDQIFHTNDSSGPGIAGLKFRDGPRGVNLDVEKTASQPGYSTAFPAPIARGAAFDLDLELRIGQAIGDETLASKNTVLLAPTINVLRHPAWGRAQETYGEDPYMLGRFGSAFVAGVQQYVPACVKHFAANNIEQGRESAVSQMADEQTFQEMYLRHFATVVQEGGVSCVMAAYNKITVGNEAGASNDPAFKSTQRKMLLTDVLRTQMGFKGFVISDWWAMPPGQPGMGGALVGAVNGPTYAQGAVQAGLDIEMPWNENFSYLVQLTTSTSGAKLATSDLDTAAKRIMEQKMRFKIDKINSATLGLKTPTSTFNSGTNSVSNDAHVTLAQEAATKGMVLLKNANNTLPIDKTKAKSVAVVGASFSYKCAGSVTTTGSINFATGVRTGDVGSSRVNNDPAKSTGPFDGIKAAAGSGITVSSATTADAAKAADFIVVVAGLTPCDEGEEYTGGSDRTSFSLDQKPNQVSSGTAAQNALITAVAGLGKPWAVVLEAGSVIDMPWLAQAPAVVMAWYPGQAGGKALGALLFGDANFSGKLPMTWPKSWTDEPTFSAGASNAATPMDYYLGYRYFDNKAIAPLFPFGFGLSYTKFEYSNLVVPCSDVTKNGLINVTVDVKNAGTVKGDETMFLFTSYPGSTVRRPAKELKAFRRVTLDPGQAKQVTIPVRVSDLKYYDQTAHAWAATTGAVKIAVGPSAADADLKLSDTVTLK
jgi:beta-glucosidase